jgi:hypothetical protein
MTRNPSVNTVAERVAGFANRTMSEVFGFSLSFDELHELEAEVYRICNSAIVNEKAGK